MIADSITRETLINAPVERVWSLITEAEHLGTWFADSGAEVDLRPGGDLVLRWNDDEHVAHGRVEKVEPHTTFAFRWAPFGDPAGVEPAEGNSTRVEFTLAPDGDATRLTVVEQGFRALATSEEQREKNLAGNTDGWKQELGELADYADKVAA